ncbi:GSU2403 family nucleotidyltransferase fold protein [Engelhardtia mirabilis]|uniref:Nucleotidyltransferase-like domain-containing protein n=1 Tax=Engelhardtia mirabilis TaxID=2528011 RepID=A0A518BRQ3_9BACT|nr:hypothetical protein Pla133_47700 [Planctomycetes bacterium Pla133]QDV03975.1 hypothetical protein Pla86_47680 [Planctomycetes bacterium Pla86]
MTEQVLKRAAGALASQGHRLVVVGGTAHRLFRHHELASTAAFEPVRTEDVDIAANRDLEVALRSDARILHALEASGFVEALSGSERAKHRYVLPGTEGYLEFIAPRTGGLAREPQAFGGVVAERLEGVDLLLHEPWTCRLESEGDETLHVVNPIAYLCQKMLVLPQREAGPNHRTGEHKRSKDLLYVFDTLTLFAPDLGVLVDRASVLRPELTAKRAKKIRESIDRFCSADNDDLSRAPEIARQQRPAVPTAAQMADAMRRELPRLLLGS